MKRLEALGGYFDLDRSLKRMEELEKEMNAPDFWFEQEKAKEVSKYYESIRQEVGVWFEFIRDIEDLLELLEISGYQPSIEKEASDKFLELQSRYASLEFNILFSGDFDSGNAILSIHAGTGGVDAQDWAQILMRAYLRFCERHGFDVRIVDETVGGEAGIKSVTLEVKGRYAYGWLRSENGVHRLVRISPFDAEKMRHTSFALVEVIPEMEGVKDIEIKDEDLKIEAMRAGGHGGQSVNTTDSAVRITHLPTGIAVKCQNERSQAQNKATAMKILKAKLFLFYREQSEKDLQEIKGKHRRAQWGNQARSYVLQPYRLVKDHRSGFETADTEAVLNGEFDNLIESFLRQGVSQ